MGKRIGRIISLLLCLAAFALTLQETVMEPVDDVLLLEERAPAYWNSLAMAKRQTLYRAEGEGTAVNYVVNTLQPVQGNGFTLQAQADGSIVFSGRNNTEGTLYYAFCEGDEWLLPDGKYLYSDGNTDARGDIRSYVEAVNDRVGGGSEYTELARPSAKKKEVSFTAEAEKYAGYRCVIAVGPGYESERTVLYPMIRAASEKDGRYAPALTENPAGDRAGLKSVERLLFPERVLYDMTEADWAVLETSLTSFTRKSGQTLLLFPGERGLVWDGEKAAFGRVTVPGTAGETEFEGSLQEALARARAAAGAAEEPESLREITGFTRYLEALRNPDYSVLISVRDDCAASLTSGMAERLRALGIQTDLEGAYRRSFLAVIDRGKVRAEASGTKVLTEEGTLGCGLSFRVVSGGFASGNRCASVLLDGKEYAMNRRGFNIVVYDNASGRVIDTAAFDTCAGLDCSRMTEKDFSGYVK